ncbi:Pyrazinamidase/nicotinamidase [Achlya hypogyna]|uniref:nicotinamidase n=1 Tax=Achlya hypogyna TaxID=1202772 RepID=A0A0A7CP23_ACHHY|nr:secreted protein [Achlya hypogyna]OQR98115.1 Pyrazinamidase/nicotinamidase [Achlya hypogyna]
MFRLLASLATVAIATAQKTALVIVDVQNDFALPTGNLSVSGGEAIIPAINKLRAQGQWDMVVLTQDWHPVNHVSFYSRWASDPNAHIYQPYTLPNGDVQVLWPNHCTQNLFGANFHKDLITAPTDVIIQKGTNPDLDSYSGLLENDHTTETALPTILKAAGITNLVVVGLAEDYCVGSTAFDAKTVFNLDVTVISDATAPVAPDSQAAMRAKLLGAGVVYKSTTEYLGHAAC